MAFSQAGTPVGQAHEAGKSGKLTGKLPSDCSLVFPSCT